LSELEALLETIMLEDFNVQAEDGSPAQVGQALLHWYQQCLAGDFTLIEQLRSVSSGAKKSRGEMVSSHPEYWTFYFWERFPACGKSAF
jgi:pre-rRNA-processing protein TSR2